MTRVTVNKLCCGKDMTNFGDISYGLDDTIENSGILICLECGNFVSFQEGILDKADILNTLNNFGSDTDKQKFVEFHPEFIDEII